MDEIEEIPLETAEGAQPPSTLGDRLIVGLAAMVLLGGVLIAATNFLGDLGPDEVAANSPAPGATATPRASRTPRPSPTPRPLRELTVVPGTPRAFPEDNGNVQMGWLEILAPTVEFAAPSTTSAEVRELAVGEILLVYLDPPGWVSLVDAQTGNQTGYVRLDAADENTVAAFHGVDNQAWPGHVDAVWPGPDGLLATVWPPQQQNAATWPMLVRSDDGERWTPIDADPVLTVSPPQMAWGPQGWIAISISPYDGTPWIWQSYDGESWDVLGQMGPGVDSGWPNRIAASSIGYVLLYEENHYNGSVTTTWFSEDGIYWQESADPFGRNDQERLNSQGASLLATDAGFFAWTVSYDLVAAVDQYVAFSSDGLHWSQIPMEDARVFGDLQLAVAGKTVMGVGRTLDGTVRAWSTDPADGAAMQLRRDSAMELAFEDTLSLWLVSDGATAYAAGYEGTSAGPAVWRSDGGPFRRLRLPQPVPFGAGAYPGALGPHGLVLIGTRPSVAGESPIFWHLRDDGSWWPEEDPIVSVVPDPRPEDCGPLPSTALEFVDLAATWGPICFGDEPMTFTAWNAPCEWCPQQPEPSSGGAWLMETPAELLLRPVAGDQWPYNEAVVYPGLQLPDDISGQWLRVTGHFDDPAAADCAFPDEPGYYGPQRGAVTYCRQRFVVTELTVVDGNG